MATGTPPYFVVEPKDPTTGNAFTLISFTAIVKDNDSDMLNITWEWGDGTDNETSTTGPAGGNTVIARSHYYNLTTWKRRMTMNITLDDGNGNLVTAKTTVDITNLANLEPQVMDLHAYPLEVEPGEETTIFANATDGDGDPLTWTFEIRNSTDVIDVIVDETAATAPGEVVPYVLPYAFPEAGDYSIALNVSDALRPFQVWPHNVSLSGLTISVVENRVPSALATLNVDPASPIVQSGVGYVLVNYSFPASDPDGDVLTVTWDFDDGSPEVVNISAGGTTQYEFVQQRNYTDAGEFNITVVVTDGRPGHEVMIFMNITIGSNNRPPNVATLVPILSGGSKARANETLSFTMVIQDAEFDPIEVVIDFGDNSTRLYLNLTDYVDGNLTAIFEHMYTEVGNYTITVWYTDNKIGLFEHEKEYLTIVTIEEPLIVEKRIWDWWDYFTLGLVGLIPVLIALRMIFVSRRRKMVEAQGMSLEEWKLVSKEMANGGKGKK